MNSMNWSRWLASYIFLIGVNGNFVSVQQSQPIDQLDSTFNTPLNYIIEEDPLHAITQLKAPQDQTPLHIVTEHSKRHLTNNNNNDTTKERRNLLFTNNKKEQDLDLPDFAKKFNDIDTHEKTKHYRAAQSTPANYGGKHPFEVMARRRTAEEKGHDISQDDHEEYHETRRMQLAPWKSSSIYEPIRIHIDTEFLHYAAVQNPDKVDFVRREILPAVKEFWESALQVFPIKENLIINNKLCPSSNKLQSTVGIPNADLAIFVAADIDSICSGEALSAARSCQADQYDRPSGGSAIMCLRHLNLQDPHSKEKFIDVMIHEFAHVLGMRALDFAYFYDFKTGLPRTPRPLKETEGVTCVDGNVVTTIMPSSTTIQSGFNKRGIMHYEVVTPTVTQIARNQFNCHEMTGARVENQPTNHGNCFGTHWEARLFSNNKMSAITTQTAQVLSPLTLALLEDSGWYKANYDVATVSSFGLYSGCDFVFDDCIQNGEVPDWGADFFCNTMLGSAQTAPSCDFTRRFISKCDLVDFDDFPSSTPPSVGYQYFFDHPTWGGLLHTADYCPMNHLVLSGTIGNKVFQYDCQDETLESSIAAEKFGKESKCLETNLSRPMCMESKCDTVERKFIAYVENQDTKVPITCDKEGELKDIPGLPIGSKFECPKLSLVCPEFFCPKNCLGRGICNANGSTPKCQCCDPDDTTEDCSKSAPCSDINFGVSGDGGAENLYCGNDFRDAQKCSSDPCPGGMNFECPGTQSCYSVESCDGMDYGGYDDTDDADSGDDDGGLKYCGVSRIAASRCKLGFDCKKDGDCGSGEQCFAVSSCTGPDDDESEKAVSGNGGYFCGSSHFDATKCSGKPCKTQLDSECPSSEYCYQIPECDEEQELDNYCGVDLDTAKDCIPGSECNSDDDCPFAQFCYEVTECGIDRSRAKYCGSDLSSAEACNPAYECIDDNECLFGQKCYEVSTCDDSIDENGTDDSKLKYCGSDLLTARACTPGLECSSDLDCDDGLACFEMSSCVGADAGDFFCGASYQSAAKCSAGKQCTNDSECPESEFCYRVLECDTEESDDSKPKYCGSNLQSASTCDSGSACDNDMDCPFGEKCFEVSSCTKPLDENFFCGSSFPSAAKCSGRRCDSMLDSECPPSELCYRVQECSEEEDDDGGSDDGKMKYCGSDLTSAKTCDEFAKCSSDRDCNFGQKCFEISSCVDTGVGDYYCGPSYPAASSCSGKRCDTMSDSECPSSEYCYRVLECNAGGAGFDNVDTDDTEGELKYCGSSYDLAKACDPGSECKSDGDCPFWQKCHEIAECEYGPRYCGNDLSSAKACKSESRCTDKSDCEGDQDCFEVSECVDPDVGDYYCGPTYITASSCSAKRCDTMSDSECPSSEYCYRILECKDGGAGFDNVDTEGELKYCGSSYDLAKACDPGSECKSDRDCPFMQNCHDIAECEYEPKYCGNNLSSAKACKPETRCTDKSDCEGDQECFEVSECIDDTEGELKYCGWSYDLAKACDPGSECVSDDDCPTAQKCYGISECEYEPKYCGDDLISAKACDPELTCNDKSDCEGDQECFEVSTCVDPSDGDYFCGTNFPHAARCSGLRCDSMADDECPQSQFCYRVTECESVDNSDFYCAASSSTGYGAISVVEEDSSGCSDDSQCAEGEICINARATDAEDDDTRDITGQFFCGSSYLDASSCKSKRCPSTSDSECTRDGEFCYRVLECTESVSVNKFCGSTLSKAAECLSESSCDTDADCPFGDMCHDVESCTNPNRFCGSSLSRAASNCNPSSWCPSGNDAECPPGQQCYDNIHCTAEPTSAPTPKHRTTTDATYSFCLEHGTLTPMFQLLRKTDKSITNSLTELFNDDVVDVENKWGIDEKNFLVASVDSIWLPDVPDYLDCNCIEGDGVAACSAIESDLSISHWSDIDENKIKYMLLMFVDEVVERMKYTATYWGLKGAVATVSLDVGPVPYSSMDDETKEIFEGVLGAYLDEDMKKSNVSDLSILVLEVDNVEAIGSSGRALRQDNRREQEGTDVEVTTTVTAQYRPPPDLDLYALLRNSFKRAANDIIDGLKESGDPFFKDLQPKIKVKDIPTLAPTIGENLGEPIDKKRGSNAGLIVGVIVTILLVIAVFAIAFIWYNKQKEEEMSYYDDGDFSTLRSEVSENNGGSGFYPDTYRSPEDPSVITDPTYQGGSFPRSKVSREEMDPIPEDYSFFEPTNKEEGDEELYQIFEEQSQNTGADQSSLDQSRSIMSGKGEGTSGGSLKSSFTGADSMRSFNHDEESWVGGEEGSMTGKSIVPDRADDMGSIVSGLHSMKGVEDLWAEGRSSAKVTNHKPVPVPTPSIPESSQPSSAVPSTQVTTVYSEGTPRNSERNLALVSMQGSSYVDRSASQDNIKKYPLIEAMQNKHTGDMSVTHSTNDASMSMLEDEVLKEKALCRDLVPAKGKSGIIPGYELTPYGDDVTQASESIGGNSRDESSTSGSSAMLYSNLMKEKALGDKSQSAEQGEKGQVGEDALLLEEGKGTRRFQSNDTLTEISEGDTDVTGTTRESEAYTRDSSLISTPCDDDYSSSDSYDSTEITDTTEDNTRGGLTHITEVTEESSDQEGSNALVSYTMPIKAGMDEEMNVEPSDTARESYSSDDRYLALEYTPEVDDVGQPVPVKEQESTEASLRSALAAPNASNIVQSGYDGSLVPVQSTKLAPSESGSHLIVPSGNNDIVVASDRSVEENSVHISEQQNVSTPRLYNDLMKEKQLGDKALCVDGQSDSMVPLQSNAVTSDHSDDHTYRSEGQVAPTQFSNDLVPVQSSSELVPSESGSYLVVPTRDVESEASGEQIVAAEYTNDLVPVQSSNDMVLHDTEHDGILISSQSTELVPSESGNHLIVPSGNNDMIVASDGLVEESIAPQRSVSTPRLYNNMMKEKQLGDEVVSMKGMNNSIVPLQSNALTSDHSYNHVYSSDPEGQIVTAARGAENRVVPAQLDDSLVSIQPSNNLRNESTGPNRDDGMIPSESGRQLTLPQGENVFVTEEQIVPSDNSDDLVPVQYSNDLVPNSENSENDGSLVSLQSRELVSSEPGSYHVVPAGDNRMVSTNDGVLEEEDDPSTEGPDSLVPFQSNEPVDNEAEYDGSLVSLQSRELVSSQSGRNHVMVSDDNEMISARERAVEDQMVPTGSDGLVPVQSNELAHNESRYDSGDTIAIEGRDSLVPLQSNELVDNEAEYDGSLVSLQSHELVSSQSGRNLVMVSDDNEMISARERAAEDQMVATGSDGLVSVQSNELAHNESRYDSGDTIATEGRDSLVPLQSNELVDNEAEYDGSLVSLQSRELVSSQSGRNLVMVSDDNEMISARERAVEDQMVPTGSDGLVPVQSNELVHNDSGYEDNMLTTYHNNGTRGQSLMQPPVSADTDELAEESQLSEYESEGSFSQSNLVLHDILSVDENSSAASSQSDFETNPMNADGQLELYQVDNEFWQNNWSVDDDESRR